MAKDLSARRLPPAGELLVDAVEMSLLEAMCTNVHVPNPAQKLYERKGFEVVGRGRGPLGIAMRKDLRAE